MTAAPSELAQRLLGAVAVMGTDGPDPMLELWSDDGVWHGAGRTRYGGSFEGLDAIRAWFDDLLAIGMAPTLLDLLEDDEHLVLFVRIQGERDGRTLDQVHANAWRIEGGQVVEGWFLPDDVGAWDAYIEALTT